MFYQNVHKENYVIKRQIEVFWRGTYGEKEKIYFWCNINLTVERGHEVEKIDLGTWFMKFSHPE